MYKFISFHLVNSRHLLGSIYHICRTIEARLDAFSNDACRSFNFLEFYVSYGLTHGALCISMYICTRERERESIISC